MQVESGRLRVVAPTERRDVPANEPDAIDAHEIPSPGRYIQEQRQRRGVSLEQLASATKIPRTSLALLEEDRYEDLPGPVFAKGFLRCCARALELDADAVMELLYERERAALHARRRDRPVSSAVPEAVVSAAEAVTAMPVDPRRSGGSSDSALHRVVATLPTPTTLLWVVVAALVTMVLMAAFNMLGSPGIGPTT